jgi:Polyketide cyclase / dehydrase and lipid transport
MPISTTTQSVEIDASPDHVIRFLADPRRIPEWAPAFADTVSRGESGWVATKSHRTFLIILRVNDSMGTVDYLREIAPGRRGGAYIRVTPKPGGGSVVSMTLPFVPDVDPEDTTVALTAELAALQRLLTSG